MNEQKTIEQNMCEDRHQHATMLGTDAIIRMQWVEKLPDGRLFTIMAVGKPDEPRCYAPVSQYLFGRISEDDGKTWGAPYLLYEWPDQEVSFCLQGWKSDRDGRIHVFASAISVFEVDAGLDKEVDLQGYIAYVRFDSYRGENPLFSDIPALYRYTGSLNNAIELDSGRLVVPFSTYWRESNNFVSNTIWSDDHGETWYASANVTIHDEEENCESGAVEPVVAEVEPGVLVMLIRTVTDCFWYAVSRDGGESWNEAKPTKIISSNAPATIQKLPDGRFFVPWNNCLGQPMQAVRYSAARQCLYGAISDDGLKTFRGIRVIVKKDPEDLDNVYNNYPTVAMEDEKHILLKYGNVQGKGKTTWKSVQGYLLRVDPAFLEETQVCNAWGDWVCDCPIKEDGILLQPTTEKVAYAIGNFPYATKGRFILRAEGDLPENCRLLLSDCYLDRSNYMASVWEERHKPYAVQPDGQFVPEAAGEWVIEWDEKEVRLWVNGKLQTSAQKKRPGYNHLAVQFEGDGALALTHYEMEAQEYKLDTGIVW